MPEPLRLLFVCTGNICRSPMAEGIARARVDQLYPHRSGEVIFNSAGVSGLDGEPATVEAVAIMRDRGVDIAAHRARSVTPQLLASSDLVLTMEARQAERVRAMAPQPLVASPERDDCISRPAACPLLRLGEAAREASRGREESDQPGDPPARLEKLIGVMAEIQREDSWAFQGRNCDIGDPMGLSISHYSEAAEAMEQPISDILGFLFS